MGKELLKASAAAAAMVLGLGAAEASPFDWSGFYLGIHGGSLNGDVSISEGGSGEPGGPISGPVWGALAGYNFPTSPSFVPGAIWGVEADFGKASVTGVGEGGVCDASFDYLYDLNWDAHFRARLGFPMGQAMPFIAGGLALADLNITEGCGGGYEGGLFTGGTIGAGLDVKIAPEAFIRGEVLYDFYGRKQYEDFSASLTAWTYRAALVFRLP
jgi:outer membrane immunogenic protein